jgi:hypothetical protein
VAHRAAVARFLSLLQDEEYLERSEKLLSGNSEQVLQLLSMYLQATGRSIYFG